MHSKTQLKKKNVESVFIDYGHKLQNYVPESLQSAELLCDESQPLTPNAKMTACNTLNIGV